ncbi:uncharacterized protein LOC129588734 [Paramacrobiotus metropolitanus]|uniref:uncharacterized protein LOC129585043 n=1 Tax=Paramacrobiotus metropolitanus TaxID=2943436 RepID=UPI0024456FBB|nr:uncharacterized protein LOC129585043 [Paramacrobiotus metropolitanus]XP_055339073.1 uncharacterized protein LOC129588734 [Paramacrobiotus metropolitanus]
MHFSVLVLLLGSAFIHLSAGGVFPEDCIVEDLQGVLDCSSSSLQEFPAGVGTYPSAKLLYFQNNELSVIPPPSSIMEMFPNVTYLDIRGNPLPCMVPTDLFTVVADCFVTSSTTTETSDIESTQITSREVLTDAPTVPKSAPTGSSTSSQSVMTPNPPITAPTSASTETEMTAGNVIYAAVGAFAALFACGSIGCVLCRSCRRSERLAQDPRRDAIEMGEVSPIVETTDL